MTETKPLPELNAGLMDGVMGWITRFPEYLDQNYWRCGTQMCCAGHTCDATGATWVNDVLVEAEPEDEEEFVFTPTLYRSDLHGGLVIGVAHRARRVLGLTEYEACVLFNGDNSLESLDLSRRWIKARRTSGVLESVVSWQRREVPLSGRHWWVFDDTLVHRRELETYAPDQLERHYPSAEYGSYFFDAESSSKLYAPMLIAAEEMIARHVAVPRVVLGVDPASVPPPTTVVMLDRQLEPLPIFHVGRVVTSGALLHAAGEEHDATTGRDEVQEEFDDVVSEAEARAAVTVRP